MSTRKVTVPLNAVVVVLTEKEATILRAAILSHVGSPIPSGLHNKILQQLGDTVSSAVASPDKKRKGEQDGRF